MEITDKEISKIYEQICKKMCGENGWFKTEEEFDNWAGDVAFDMLFDFCEFAGIKISDE